jgi:hypothetical protein
MTKGSEIVTEVIDLYITMWYNIYIATKSAISTHT